MNGKKVLGALLVLLVVGLAGLYFLGPLYVWGGPMLEQRHSSVDRVTLEQSIFELERSVISVSRGGQGSARRVDMKIGNGEVYLNETGNYIELQVNSESNPYPPDWTLLRGRSRQGLSVGNGEYGIQGENTPGVVAVRSESGRLFYRVEFRDLRTSTPAGLELRGVELVKQEDIVSREGWANLSIVNEGRETGYRTVSGVGNLSVSETVVSVSMASE